MFSLTIRRKVARNQLISQPIAQYTKKKEKNLQPHRFFTRKSAHSMKNSMATSKEKRKENEKGMLLNKLFLKGEVKE